MKMVHRILPLLIGCILHATIASAQLTGEWTDEYGGCHRIRQVNNTIYWSLDDRPRVINVFFGYLTGSTIDGSWADLPGGSLQGYGTITLRVESNDRIVKIGQSNVYRGSVLTRGSCQQRVPGATNVPDLSGTWYDYSARSGNVGAVSTILQNGDKLTFINSYNERSDGAFIDSNTVIANGWEGGLRATLEDNARRIVWANGSVWQRTRRSGADSQIGGPCSDPRTLAIMDEWLAGANPPENQQRGWSVRYESWGRLVGRSPSATLSVPYSPDTRLTRCDYLWSIATTLRSANLGTLREYVEKRRR